MDYLAHESVVSVTIDDAAPNYGRDASGYGRKIPTRYRLRMSDGRTRRVYVVCYSNAGTSYVVVNDEPQYLSSDTEHLIREATVPARMSSPRWPASRSRVVTEMADPDYVSACPACGDVIDYCQGHGPMADPNGYRILDNHYWNDTHTECHPNSDCQGETCDECGHVITNGQSSLVNPTHGDGCSLNPDNTEHLIREV